MFTVNKQIAFLTKHDKQHQIAPLINTELNAQIIHTDKFDTDKLGTFDHKIQRKLRADEAAIRKAYLACELTNLNQGIGSEGSFNSFMGLSLVDQEIIAFVDIERKLEIVAMAQQSVPLGLIEAKNSEELKRKLNTNSYISSNSQRWMVWLNNQWNKGVKRNSLLAEEYAFPIKIEPDLRAMHCPARQDVIKLATQDLVKRLTSLCPKCTQINFVEKIIPNQIEYLACEICSLPTNQPKPPSCICDECGYTESTSDNQSKGSAFYCNYCNP